MAHQPKNIGTESQFYQALHEKCFGLFHFERIEPSNESGFPDVAFVERKPPGGFLQLEGTIELKICGKKTLALPPLMRGTQKTALLEYYEAGGRRRYVLCYHKGVVHFWNTHDAVQNLLGKSDQSTSSVDLECDDPCSPQVGGWLLTMIRLSEG